MATSAMAVSAASRTSTSFTSPVYCCEIHGSKFCPCLNRIINSRVTKVGCRSVRTYGVRCMAPDEEKMTKRSPLDFPIEWDRPAPGRRPDIFPQFSPMKVPLPPPLPCDPPEQEEDEEEEEKEEEEEEEKKKPDKEPEKPKE